MTSHPCDLLATLLEALDGDRPIPREVRGWLRAGLRSYLHEDRDLEAALGLSAEVGHSHIRNLLHRARRDAFIKAAARALPGSLNARAAMISRGIRERDAANDMPEDARLAIAYLAEEFERVPTSRAQLARILNDETTAARLLAKPCNVGASRAFAYKEPQ